MILDHVSETLLKAERDAAIRRDTESMYNRQREYRERKRREMDEAIERLRNWRTEP